MTETEQTILAALEAIIDKLGQERRIRRDTLLKRLRTLAIATALLAILIALVTDRLFVLAIIAGLIIGVWLTHRAQLDWEQAVRDEVIPAVCAGIGQLTYQPDPPIGDFLTPFEALGLVGRSNRKTLEHYFSGLHNGRRFEYLHASLRNRGHGSNSSTTNVFHGLLFRIEKDSETPSPVAVLPNLSLQKYRRGKTRVELGNPDFDGVFWVTHDTSAEAGESLVSATVNPHMQRALLAINQAESPDNAPKRALRVGFMYDSIYVALSRWETESTWFGLPLQKPRLFLQTRSLLREYVDMQQTVATMVQDITTVHRIIAALDKAA